MSRKIEYLSKADVISVRGPHSRKEVEYLHKTNRFQVNNGIIGVITTPNPPAANNTCVGDDFTNICDIWNRPANSSFSIIGRPRSLAASNAASHSIVITSTGQVLTTGSASGVGQGGSARSNWANNNVTTDARMASCGNNWSMVVTSDGRLFTTGVGTNNRTGNNSTSSTTSFGNISQGFSNWENGVAGFDFGYGVRSSGELYSWGNNVNSATAQGTSTGSTAIPTRVGIGTDWAGCKFLTYQDTSALSMVMIQKTNNTFWCAGSSLTARVPVSNSSSNTLIQIPGTPTATVISFALSLSCSLMVTDDGRLWGARNVTNILTSATNTTNQYTQIGSDTDWLNVWSSPTAMAFLQKTDGSVWVIGSGANLIKWPGLLELNPSLTSISVTNQPFRYGLLPPTVIGNFNNHHILWGY